MSLSVKASRSHVDILFKCEVEPKAETWKEMFWLYHFFRCVLHQPEINKHKPPYCVNPLRAPLRLLLWGTGPRSRGFI